LGFTNAAKVRLLQALDQLFSVFVPVAKCQCPKHNATEEEKDVADTLKREAGIDVVEKTEE
jgi:hypothetical protein